MIFQLKRKVCLMLKINQKNAYKYECIKICLIYLVIGASWIYFSDKIAHKFASNDNMLLIISTYKGWAYVVVTSIILYLLINQLIKKVNLTEFKLNESRKELSASNEELQANLGQLIATEEELRAQYDQLMENEKKLSISEQKNRAVIEILPDLLFIINKDGYFIDCMASDATLLLFPRRYFIGKTIAEIMPNEISKIAYEKMQSVLELGVMEKFEYKLEISKEIFYFELRMLKNNETEVLAIARNISDRKQMETKLEYLSYNDTLTGLYNRRFFEKELIRLNIEKHLPLTIVMADVNGLKLVNDSFGHTKGDDLLIKVAKVIKNGFRKDDIVARLAGDEFVVLMPNTNASEAEKLIKSVKTSALKESLDTIDISISFGYETKIRIEENLQDIFKKAEDNMYKQKLFESPSMRGKTIKTIISTLHEKNKREEQHSYRVSILCESMGKALGLPEDKIKELKTIGLLHDIGKIAIEENILNKPGKLTDEEFKQIKRHPEIGYRILSTVNDLSEIAEYVLAHHEKYDGKGYPKGLKGEEIPLQARIIAIADTYDAMVSERSYRSALPEEVAIKELLANAGTQFDEKLTMIFIKEILKIKQ